MIRLAKNEDIPGIKILCDRYNIAFPDAGAIVFVSVNNCIIDGVCALEKSTYIEPLIAENPVTAYNLGVMAEGMAVGNGDKKISAIVDVNNKKLIAQLLKYGFEVTDTKKIIMEKKYYG